MLSYSTLKVELTDFGHSDCNTNNKDQSEHKENSPNRKKNYVNKFSNESLDVDNMITKASESVIEVESSDSFITVVDEEEAFSLILEDNSMYHSGIKSTLWAENVL